MKSQLMVLAFSCLPLIACVQESDGSATPYTSSYTAVEAGDDTCVFDSATQLVWQTKTAGAGLNSAENTYSWFSPHEANGELDYRGLENGGQCDGSACDTWHYVEAVNLAELCGFSDWRMPTKDEIYSLSDLTRAEAPPTIDTDFFPLTRAAEYWTANDYSFQWDAAWAWNFALGHDRVDWKKEAKFVRLVRGTPGPLDSVKE